MKLSLQAVESAQSAGGVRLVTVTTEVTRDDGSTIKHVMTFPEDILEWRAAEYGIDPEDKETLLDIVLYEPLLPDDDQPELSLHQAPSIEAARTRHLERIQAVIGQKPGNRPAGFDPVREQIKAMVPMNPVAISLKAQYVGKAREAIARERATMAAQPAEAVRVERLRKSLTAKLPN